MSTPTEADVIFKNQRRDAISRHPTQIGIDYVVVKEPLRRDESETPQPWELELYFIPAADPATKTCIIPQPLPAPHQVQITGLTPLVSSNILVASVAPMTENVGLVVTIRYDSDAAKGMSDLPTYVLTIDEVPHLDPFFNHVTFSLAIDTPSNFDASAPLTSTVPALPGLDINYLAKDFNSFRQLMLNRLSLTMPQWVESSPADLGQVLVDILAYAARCRIGAPGIISPPKPRCSPIHWRRTTAPIGRRF